MGVYTRGVIHKCSQHNQCTFARDLPRNADWYRDSLTNRGVDTVAEWLLSATETEPVLPTVSGPWAAKIKKSLFAPITVPLKR